VRKYCDSLNAKEILRILCAAVMKPDSDAFNFYLIYATRHAKGVEVFKSVEKRTEERTHVVRAMYRNANVRTGRQFRSVRADRFISRTQIPTTCNRQSRRAKRRVLDSCKRRAKCRSTIAGQRLFSIPPSTKQILVVDRRMEKTERS